MKRGSPVNRVRGAFYGHTEVFVVGNVAIFSTDPAMAQAQVDLDKTYVRAGVDGRLEARQADNAFDPDQTWKKVEQPKS